MTWVFRVGNQTLRITASNAAEALRRARIVFPGQTISEVREGGRSGDANFRLINPSYIDAQNNPVYTAESTTGDLTGARAPEFTRDTYTTADPARDTGGMGGNGDGGQDSAGYVPPPIGEDVPGADISGTSMFASFLRNLRERNVPTGLASTLLERQSYPSQQTFLAENELANLRRGIGLENVELARQFDPETANATYEQFLRGLQPGFAGIGKRTRDAFSQFADLARRATQGGPRMMGGASGIGGLTDLEQIAGLQYARPDFETEEGKDTANMLSDLARQAAISGFNPIVGQRLFGGSAYSPGRLQADFLSQQGTAGLPSSNFADFLRQRFGQPAVRSGF